MKKFLPFFLFIFSAVLYAQQKDTIIVYQEVIEYDTVYVKKPNVVVNPRDQRPGRRKRKIDRNTDFSFSVYGGTKNINAFHEESQRGLGVGMFLRRNAFTPEMSISLGAQFFHWPENQKLKTVSAYQNYRDLSFSDLLQPPKLQYFSNEHNEIILPLNFYYTWKNISPYIGVFLNYTSFKMTYEIEPRSIPSKFYEFTSNQYNFGYATGILYQNSRFGISIEYQQHELLKMNFGNTTAGNIHLKYKDGFQDHKFLLGIHLSLVQ